MTQSVEATQDGALGTIVLNRPQAMNCLDEAMATGLQEHSARFAEDPSVRCILIRGAGDNFMAGGDIRYFHELLDLPSKQREQRIEAVIATVHASIENLMQAPKPVVASVQGACAGFGLSLMLACDFALLARNATLSLAYCRIGASPDGGSTYSLPRTVGMKRAMELALLGERFDAERALQMGMVTDVVDDDSLHGSTQQLVEKLIAGPTAALARTKRLLVESSQCDLATQLRKEADSFVASALHEEFAEGVNAFVSKRRADFMHNNKN